MISSSGAGSSDSVFRVRTDSTGPAKKANKGGLTTALQKVRNAFNALPGCSSQNSVRVVDGELSMKLNGTTRELVRNDKGEPIGTLDISIKTYLKIVGKDVSFPASDTSCSAPGVFRVLGDVFEAYGSNSRTALTETYAIQQVIDRSAGSEEEKAAATLELRQLVESATKDPKLKSNHPLTVSSPELQKLLGVNRNRFGD
jgi:hypothetical protein